MPDMELYQFTLPNELIAQTPAHPRDHARLLVYKLEDGSLFDDYFYNIRNYLNPSTTVVLNNSKVEECRWLFDEHNLEIFVLQKLDRYTIHAYVKPGRKFRLGKTVALSSWLQAEVTSIDANGIRTLVLSQSHDDPRLKQYEHIPLPPYIAQKDELAEEYQTVYAKPAGSLAAPTAGLHFTKELYDKIAKSHSVVEITLHVGLGTFAKLQDNNFETNKLHSEHYYISKEAAMELQDATHITAVGTTSLRTLESAMKTGGYKSGAAETDIFIRPGYNFKSADSLITNFHLPSTSLLLLVAAFIGDKKRLDETNAAGELQRIYAHAIKNEYRFYSFGDAMILV